MEHLARKKLNCWEFNNCGREKNGENSIKFGVCPASVSTDLNGMNSGKAAGRACWSVHDTLCNDSSVKSFYKCLKCSFYNYVKKEEGNDFHVLPQWFSSLT